MKRKRWIIVILIVIILITLGITSILYLNKNENSENDMYNVNNNSGNLAVKINEFYYIMGTDFFIKIDENNNTIKNIGKENNISNFTTEPNMQIFGDYIYYSVGGYYQEIYRYNYRNNKIEKYELPEEIRKASGAGEGVCSTYFIRKNNLYYQPYAEDYYYEINLETKEYKKLKNLEVSAQTIILSFEPNMYKDNIYYNKNNQLNCLNVKSNTINTIINHKCDDVIIHDNKIYYCYNNGIYKSDISGKNEELIYNSNESASLITINDKYLYIETTAGASSINILLGGTSTKSLKIIDINTKEEVNEIKNYKNISIIEEKLIITNYEEKEAYIHGLDGSGKTLIQKTIIEEDTDNEINNKNEIDMENVEQKEEKIEEHPENKVRVTAEVYFLSKAEGGRHTPFFPGYQPEYKIRNIKLKGKIVDLNSSMVMPGDTVTITIDLYTEENFENGIEIQVIEGEKLVGKGTIKQVHNDPTSENPDTTTTEQKSEEEEIIDSTKTHFNVFLKETGNQDVRVMQVLKNELGLSLSEAKELTKNTPIMIKENMPRQEAIELKSKLTEVGAIIELK